MEQPVPDDLLETAEVLVPDAPLGSPRLAEHGNLHHVVLFPGVAAVRISKRPDTAAESPRRAGILRAVAAAGLPFAVPEPHAAFSNKPLSHVDGYVRSLVSWLEGREAGAASY